MLAAAGLALILAACAVADPSAVLAPAFEPAVAWQTLAGGWLAPGPVIGARRVMLGNPCGIAVRGTQVLIADCGAGELLRYDRMRDTITISSATIGPAPGPSVPMFIAADSTAFVANPTEGIVTRYDPEGWFVRRYGNSATPMRPVGIAFDPLRGELLVADADQRRIIVFGAGGDRRGVLGGERAVAFQSVAALALGPEGIYVLDRHAQQVVVLGRSGELLRTFSDDSLIIPGLMAVDAAGRVFVVDEADQTVSVFAQGEHVSRIGGRGSGAEEFGNITALAVDDNLLYVVDGARAHVRIMLLTPESMRPRSSR